MSANPNLLQRNIEEAQSMIAGLATLAPQVDAAVDAIATALFSGHKLLACGNGGSAADASHLTTEFVCRYQDDRRAYPAISLATQGGDLTAIGNDYTFDHLFSRQIEAFGIKGDVLAAFSTSGKSENIYRALTTAKQRGVITIAFLGKGGGKCAGLADIELIVANNTTARIQEAHKLLLHTICEMLEVRFKAAS